MPRKKCFFSTVELLYLHDMYFFIVPCCSKDEPRAQHFPDGREQTGRELHVDGSAIYGSPLQRWALEANNVVQAEFHAADMPFFDIEQIRKDVEQLSKGGDSALFRLPAITGNGFLPMVPEFSNGWYNNRSNDNQSQITVPWTRRPWCVSLRPFDRYRNSPSPDTFTITTGQFRDTREA